MIQAVTDRRSIRKYTDREVPRSLIEEILKAGILAPSSKNRQPWSFTVVTRKSKEEMLAVMRKGLERESVRPLLTESAAYMGDAWHTWEIMGQVPVIIFVRNILGENMRKPLTWEERVAEICNVQSIGAAIENMALTAEDMGLGSLWICNIFFAYRELQDWLGGEGELCAALAIGYAEEAPPARPRKKMEDCVFWRM